MPDVNTTTQRLDGLALRFETRDPQAAGRFRSLADDLRAGGNRAAEWAFRPLNNIFDPQKLVEDADSAQNRPLEIVEAARNILVLVPLVVTWVGIFLAAEAYARLVAQDQAQAAQSFIYLWQNGFGNSLWFTLSKVAIFDGAILGLVVILTIIMHIFGGQRRAGTDNDEELRREIESTMYEVDSLLAIHRAPEAARVANSVREVAETNLKTMNVMTDTTLKQMSAMNAANLEQLKTMTQNLVSTIGQEYNRFEGLAKQRAEEIAGLTQFTSQLQAAGASIAQVATAVGQAEEEIKTTVSSLKAPIVGLTSATALLAKTAGDIVPAVSDASQNLTALTKEQASTVAGLTTLTEGQRSVAEGMQLGVRALTDSVVQAGTATSQLATASNHLSEEQDRLINALETERSAQATLANHVSRANYEFGEVLDQFSQAVVSIKATAADMMYAAQKFHTMEDVVRDLQSGLGDVVRMQSNSAAHIEAATNRIEVASSSFETTVQQLKLASDSLANSAGLLAQALAAQPTMAHYR